MKKKISFICLIVCTFIWGTTFIAQDTGMDNIGPFTFNSVRFFVGFLVVVPFVLLFEKKKVYEQIKGKRNKFYKLIISRILRISSWFKSPNIPVFMQLVSRQTFRKRSSK